MALLGLEALLARRPAGLSGGEKARVGIGRALLSSPRLLLLDEPLAALDEARKAEILPYLERLRDIHQRADVADRADVDLAARQEGDGAFEVDGEAALDAAEDHAFDALVRIRHLLEAGPGFLAAGLVTRQNGLAHRILDALQVDFDGVADLDFRRLARLGEFLDGDLAFGLQTDIDDRKVVLDGDDAALDHTAFGGGVVGIALGEERFEVFTGGGERDGGFRHVGGVPVQIEETRSVSPTLGSDSIRSGVLAGVSGLALVMAFTFLYYRFAGLVAIVGLLINIALLLGAMAMFNFTLTLPGIAGIILTIGMAVDANVLIFERLREEMAAGKSLPTALAGAYDKAFSAIFDANATTLITALILFWQASGSVKGFAVTLTLGIIASMFSALLFTRTAFRWLVEKGGLKSLRMLDLVTDKKFDFLGKRKLALVFSILMIGGSIAIFAVRGEKNFGIDFRGGDLLIVDSAKPITVPEARSAINDSGVVIQFEREGTKEVLTFRSAQGTSDVLLKQLQTSFPDRGLVSIGQDTVGPQIGMEFAKSSLIALGLGMVGIFLYVTLQFEFSFALGAVVALLHDIIITIGVFALIGGELSLVMVGAILTIAGYSINDTIVVFDRIREGLKNGERGSIQTIMNISINETLGRTLLTGGTTLLSVGALYFFGGTVLRDFSFAILVGILVGTYSSVYVASPVVLWSSKLRGKSVRREVLETEALKKA